MKYLIIIGIVYIVYRFTAGRKSLNPPTEPWQEEDETTDYVEIDSDK